MFKHISKNVQIYKNQSLNIFLCMSAHKKNVQTFMRMSEHSEENVQECAQKCSNIPEICSDILTIHVQTYLYKHIVDFCEICFPYKHIWLQY